MNKFLKTTFILLLALFGANSSFSQTLVWEKVTGFTNKPDYCFSSAPLGKSRYVFAGYQSQPQQNYVFFPLIVFTNTGGDTLFTKRYYQLEYGQIKAMATHKDSTIIAAGFYAVNTGEKTFMFKADYNGNIIWQKDIPGTGLGNRANVEIVPGGYLLYAQTGATLTKLNEQGDVQWQKALPANVTGGSVKLMKDGSYIACGNTNLKSPANLSSYHKTNPMLLQLRPNGDTIRTKIIGSFQNHDLAHEARQTSDGGVIVVGRYVLNTNPTKMQGLVMKFDSLWNQQWWYTIMPPHGAYDEGCELFNVQQLADSSYIVSGNYIDSHPSGFGDRNGYVANIAKDGSAITWQQQYKANTLEWFTSMFYKSDGSAVFSGYRNVSNNIDFYLVKLKNLGLPYVPDYCQQEPTPQLSIQVITGDSIAFTSTSVAGTQYGTISTYTWRFGDGNSSSEAAPKHKYNMPLAQLQNIPVTLIVTSNSGCTDSITVYPYLQVSAPGAMPGLQVQLYPNPASSQATFSISGYTGQEPVTVELLDVLGRKLKVPVKQQQAGEVQQLEVNTAALPAGLYLYRLYSGSRLLGSGKLVKEN